jgi:hypothetical protein
MYPGPGTGTSTVLYHVYGSISDADPVSALESEQIGWILDHDKKRGKASKFAEKKEAKKSRYT